MDTLGGKELESVMMGGRGVVGSTMGYTKRDQNGYSASLIKGVFDLS